MTVLGGSGAWPTADRGCSGYLVEHDGFRLLIDPGYATLQPLLSLMPASEVDAVLVSHGHPDHCADLNPLLRARTLSAEPPPALPLFALPGALDAVLALDRAGMLEYGVREFDGGDRFEIGPFGIDTWLLPHFVPNAGLRVTAGGRTLAYTGDTGPSPDLVRLARGADLFLAEATFPREVVDEDPRYLSTALQAARVATASAAGKLMLTHLWPGEPLEPFLDAAGTAFGGPIEIARPGPTIAM